MCAGRVDDVINVSGHRIGTAEVEGALTQHPRCAEAAVVPMEHPIKGQGIYAFVTLMVVRPASTLKPADVWACHELARRIFRRNGPCALPIWNCTLWRGTFQL